MSALLRTAPPPAGDKSTRKVSKRKHRVSPMVALKAE